MKLLAEPEVTGNGLFEEKAVGGIRGEFESEAHLDDEQRMREQETAQVGGVAEAFTDADEQGFEVGTQGMSRPPTSRTRNTPALDERPIEQRKEGAIVLDNRVMIEHGGQGRLVKEGGSRYHSKGLLL